MRIIRKGTGEMNHETHPYHRRSIRLKGYDYTLPGGYFVTIVTKDRTCIFGDIVDGVMMVNNLGAIVIETWSWLAIRYSYLSLDAFCLMPNHFQGIIILHDTCRGAGETLENVIYHEIPRAPTIERFGAPTPGSIPTIIRSFKSS